MKKFKPGPLVLIMLLVFLNIINQSCRKPPLNNPPVANAGEHIMVFPADTVKLDGWKSNDFDGKIISYEWKKISGPLSYTLENGRSPVATITNLQGGTYQFELTVIDNSNQYGKDTVTVSVFEVEPGAREVNFTNLQWIDFWGYFLEIQNFHSFVPASAVFRVFVKSNNIAGWHEVINYQQLQNQRYQYGVTTDGIFWIESFNIQAGTADVKIVF